MAALSRGCKPRKGINTEIALKYVLNYILKIQYYTQVNDKR